MKKTAVSLLLVTALLFAGYVNTDTQSETPFTDEGLNDSHAVGYDGEGQVPGADSHGSNRDSSNSDLSDESIRVGAFNIQVFGKTKASKPEVMQVLAEIIRTYDILAVQEIRDSSGTALPSLISLVNSDGSQYSYVVSERLGRTSSKEQYAYVYDTNTIVITGKAHTYPEPEGTDPFHRQPFITSFKTISGNYDAVLMVIHTDPDEATEEINALDEVLEYSRITYPEEQDFIIMGDFNADGSYFDEDSVSDISGTGFSWVIDNSQDTTVASSSNTYDRIVLTDSSDYITSAVYHFDDEYGLSSTQAAEVSDHYPVYVEFGIGNDNDEDVSPSILISGISLRDEWVSIRNTGSLAVSLEGWSITDEGNTQTYVFHEFVLDSGATVTLHTESGADNATDLYWGRSRPIWNNDGDTARLYDSDGNLVDTSE